MTLTDGKFWAPSDDAHRVAIADAKRKTSWTYQELSESVDILKNALRAPVKSLAFVLTKASPESVFAYLACLRSGHAALLVDASTPAEMFDSLLAAYRPEFLLGTEHVPAGYVNQGTHSGVSVAQATACAGLAPLNPELALLLSTSGTTGSPKCVRLSLRCLAANAASIATYLELTDQERAIVSLPFHYSYGLSVLNSHLLASATLVFPPEGGVLVPGFWQAFRESECTSFAGVPYSYQMLNRIGWLRSVPRSLRTMTQAGGRLDPQIARKVHDALAPLGARLFVMYGQTEATARMTYVPPEYLADRPGSIGRPIPGGRLRVVRDGDEILNPGETGELVYEGANVMLGYSIGRDDLALGDEQQGRLATGDVGHFDADGFFYVTGRIKRFAKVFGQRVNLDEVEALASSMGGCPAAAVDVADGVVVFVITEQPTAELALALAARLRLNVNTLSVRTLAHFPLKPSGKIDYEQLRP